MPEIVIVGGGPGAEREVSLRSAQAVFEALKNRGNVRLATINGTQLPADLNPERDLLFLTTHGTFGEDGHLQALLDERGFAYTGCDSRASAICFNKQQTKQLAERMGLKTAPGVVFEHTPTAAALYKALGPKVVLKPEAEGSSVGLYIINSQAELATALAEIESQNAQSATQPQHSGSTAASASPTPFVFSDEDFGGSARQGRAPMGSVSAHTRPVGAQPQHSDAPKTSAKNERKYLAEKFIEGRELTVGILNGQALTPVEIIAEGGVYDYAHKYTPGHTTYQCPANLDSKLSTLVRTQALKVCQAANVRDFARVDFRLTPEGTPIFLEINTLPGMTATSLLPKSAAGYGLDFPALLSSMLRGASARWAEKYALELA